MQHWNFWPLWSDVRAVPSQIASSCFHLGVIAPATVSDTCNESVNPFILRSTTNGLAFLALLLESWDSVTFNCLSCNKEQMALMSISVCVFVTKFLPRSISASDGNPLPLNFADVDNWLFVRLTSLFKVLCKRTADTYRETGYGRLCFFFLENAITGSECLKPADISRIVQGIYTPLKKIATISGVLGDLINYHSLHSPYDTQYCAIFMERR